MSGWIFLAIGAAAAIVDLLVGLHFTRARAELIPQPGAESADAVAQRNLAGRIVVGLALLFFLVFAVIAFGIVPVAGIEPISLN